MIAIDRVIAEPDFWPRERLARERVDDFRELYADGGPSALPPLTVISVGTGYLLADGWNRFAAMLELGWSTVPVVLLDTGGRDGRLAAYEEGLTSCATSAAPLTRAEKHAAILRLTVQGDRTDREIARLVGVSHQTVARVRTAAAGDPQGQTSSDPVSTAASALDLSRRLVRGVRRIWDARGFTDLIAGRLPRNLADALIEEFGDDEALVWARRLTSWATAAQNELEGR